MQPLVACPGRGGRDDLYQSVQIDEWLEVCGRVRGGREAEEGVVRLITGLEERDFGIEDDVAENRRLSRLLICLIDPAAVLPCCKWGDSIGKRKEE